ncbi:centrosomal protein of 72 kDa [Trichosurus vulpecula]|uniref:centrosomal protein of 72 kDa n=1 Tax=Trichosurus vulpecula TaxID=9337 RepID=UPI00186AE93E|nr:centrosomal protein of 72 kDa [Trichosurus vulpecula]
MAAAPKLVLSEEKIWEKSGFGHRDMGLLQSLSIPGTYQEKITHLGNSLKNLTYLKSLDLSRNSLVCLEGIEYLTLLENLNLYYNNISSLTEVFRLHQLTELKDVDLRLNPVAKNEPDYRLFLVYIIPRLRQLDNRLVRESERKASLSHFSMEETFESKQISSNSLKNKAERDRHSRTKYIDSPTKKCSVMDAEDEAVLTLIAKCQLDLSKPPGIISASKKDCAVPEFHNLQGQARHVLSSVQTSVSNQENSSIMSEKINHLILENKALQNLAEQEQQYNIRINGLMLELNNTLQEMDTLKQQLSKSLEENNSLKSRLLNMEQDTKQGDSSAVLTVQINELQNSNQELSSEVDNLKEHLEHYAKIQELTEMLQESHSSLISTNEHLLQELTQTHIRHKAEVEQLHWSYKELKKTMSQFPLSNSDVSSG